MEDRQTRLKRLTMRSWRRGIKEMDLILGPYADAMLTTLTADELDDSEARLAEHDQDLYPWVSARTRGGTGGPAHLDAALTRVAGFASASVSKNRAT